MWKIGRIENSGKIKNILIFLFFVWLEVKSGEMKKTSLYKFTHMSLLKNDTQLKQKNDKQQPKKKKSVTQI